MSSADASKAQTFFQYGNEAALKSNFDYAIEMYQRACKLAPENLLYRQALRGTERKKFQNDPSKVGRLVGARLQPIRLKMRGPKSKQNWSQVLEICEEAFVLHPWDVTTAREAAEAAEHLGHDLLAQWLLESVAAQATDADFFRHIAAVHALNENWQKAIQAWERVKQIEPTDEVANRMINQLSASSTIQRSGLGDALEQRKAAPAAEEQGPDPEELARRKLTPEQRRVKEIQEDPRRVSSYLHLSDLLQEKNQLEEAEKVLARGIKANPDSPELRFAHAEVQIRRLQHAVDVYTRRTHEKPDDPALKAKLDQYTNMLIEYEVKEYRRRVALDPADMGLRFQLGLRLARAGKHDEAIAEFQQARSDPELKVQAQHQAGVSFEAKGALKLAERSYTEALKSADPADAATINVLHYRLGRVAEAQGNNKEAEEHYNEVASNDYSYLDVAQRLQYLS